MYQYYKNFVPHLFVAYIRNFLCGFFMNKITSFSYSICGYISPWHRYSSACKLSVAKTHHIQEKNLLIDFKDSNYTNSTHTISYGHSQFCIAEMNFLIRWSISDSKLLQNLCRNIIKLFEKTIPLLNHPKIHLEINTKIK
mgnify:FL=1